MGVNDRRFLFLLLIYSLFISLIEIVGVAAIMPFIAVATDFSLVEKKNYFSFIYHALGFDKPIDFVLAFGLLLILFYVLRSLLNGLYFHLLARFSKGRFYTIATKIYESYLFRSYRDFISFSRAELQKVIVTEAQNMMGVLSSILFMMSEIFIVLLVYMILLTINWKITLLITLFLSINFFILLRVVSKKIKESGKGREESEREFFHHLQNSFGNIKMIKLADVHEEYLGRFRTTIDRYVGFQIRFETLREVPRLYLEATGFIIVITIILYFLLSQGKEVTAYLPLISVFILSLYRLLPSFHRIFGAYHHVLYHYRSVEVISQQIFYPREEGGEDRIEFKERIECRHIGFSYTPDRQILEDLNLTVSKGERIGIVGESGSGKSTLIDILIGLFRPTEGTVLIDGVPLSPRNVRDWRRKIGYIPQQIELIDGTVAQNVALSDHYDRKRVETVLRQAQLLDYLIAHHQGIDTEVGDNGIRLSGGQRQRIAIARALYRDPELLVLDEATSALDRGTEERIMEDIYALEGKTIVIVAHRIQTLRRCGKIYEIIGGRCRLLPTCDLK